MDTWQRYGDTPEQAATRLIELYEDRIRQVDALYSLQQRLAKCLARFTSNSHHLRSLTHYSDAELSSAMDNATGVLKEAGY